MSRDRCGAKTRAGTPCQLWPLTGKTRCKLHGGRSTGAGKGNQNATAHGIYKSVLSEAEQANWAQIEIGKVDEEIRLWRTRLVRALEAEQAAKDKPELEEIVARKIGSQEPLPASKPHIIRSYAVLRTKTLAFVLMLPLAVSGCQSVPSVPPATKLVPVTCPAQPTPPAWMMEPSEPNFTQRLLDALSGSEARPTSVQGN